MWPALLEAKERSMKIRQRIDALLKNHNGLSKAEIAKHNSLLIEETDAAIEEIEAEMKAVSDLLYDHKKYLSSKKKFLKRHYKSL